MLYNTLLRYIVGVVISQWLLPKLLFNPSPYAKIAIQTPRISVLGASKLEIWINPYFGKQAIEDSHTVPIPKELPNANCTKRWPVIGSLLFPVGAPPPHDIYATVRPRKAVGTW